MKVLVLDTHALVWFLQKDSRLPDKSSGLILDDAHLKVIPFIVMCEIHYLHSRKRFPVSVGETADRCEQAANFEIASHTPDQLDYLDSRLDIHDGLIVATAQKYDAKAPGSATIISKDNHIRKFSRLPVVWDR